MKKHILPAAISLLFLTSCNLDRFPEDQVATETFWNSQNDALLGLNGVYTLLDRQAYAAWYQDGFTDNAYNQYPWESGSTAASAGDVDPSTDFGYDYSIIRRANTFLENIGRVNMNATLKKRYTAEAKFLRAYNYFALAQIFGPVPLVKTSSVDPATLKPTSEAEVIAFVLQELTDASADLPLSYPGGSGNETGRVTKGAALSLKARVQLYYNKWAEAAATAKQVMDLGVYRLYSKNTLTPEDFEDDYSQYVTFASNTDKTNFYKGLRSYEQLFWAANQTNSEFILVSQYMADSPYEKSSGIYTLLMPNQVSGWSSITPTVDLVNAYWKRDGSVFSAPSATTRASNYNNGNVKAAYLEEFKDRDTRLYASIMFPTSPWNKLEDGFTFAWPKGANNTSKTGYNFRKLVDPNYIDEWNAAQDYPIIRYAEILLTYAEAKNEASGPDATVYDALDQIRDRVAMPRIARTQSQASLREIIRNERRIELAEEGQRYADMRRWGLAPTVMHDIYDITNTLVQKRVWNNKFLRMPYPQTSVDRNPLLKEAQATKGY